MPALRLSLCLLLPLAFWLPAAAYTHGHFPAPLDDVYIYFNYARATADGCFLCAEAGSGGSTGATSPLYALLLSALELVAWSPQAMGWLVAALTVALLYDTTSSLASLFGRRIAFGSVLSCALFGLPILDWSLVSGMETAWVGALMARTLAAVDGCARSSPSFRSAAQTKAGVLIALLAVSRPELLPMGFLFALSVVHASGSRPLLGSLGRAFLPLLALFGALSLWALQTTGQLVQAGAVRKVALYDPLATRFDAAVVALINLVRLSVEGFELAIGGRWVLALLLVCTGFGLRQTRDRRLVLPLAIGGVASLLLIAFNRTAPFQNLRYLAPNYLGLLMAAVIGVRSGSRPFGLAVRAAPLGLALAIAAFTFPKQLRHYALSAKNIHEQQVAVGLRLRELAPRRVFVGDAGAIPYFSGRPSLDGLGLGGFRAMPFAKASVLGEGAVVELIERLPASERPDTLAIYESWWPDLSRTFGERQFSVLLEDNLICGAPEKTVYSADWSLLEDRRSEAERSADRIDFGDLIDEELHKARFFPREPRVGFDVHQRKEGRSFDGVRRLEAGQWLQFELATAGQPRVLELQLGPSNEFSFSVERGALIERFSGGSDADEWLNIATATPNPSSTVTLRVHSGLLKLGAARLLPAQ